MGGWIDLLQGDAVRFAVGELAGVVRTLGGPFYDGGPYGLAEDSSLKVLAIDILSEVELEEFAPMEG